MRVNLKLGSREIVALDCSVLKQVTEKIVPR